MKSFLGPEGDSVQELFIQSEPFVLGRRAQSASQGESEPFEASLHV